MMKEWADARQRVQELKEVDPKAADKLNKEITAVSLRILYIPYSSFAAVRQDITRLPIATD